MDLDAEQVAHYLDEIGAPEAVRQEWDGESGFHETYTKHAKTFVRLTGDDADPSCLRPVGFTIEFLPDRDPTAVKVGESLAVKAVKGGNEMESFAVGVVCGATGESTLLRTSKAGFVSFPITDGGWWLVRGTELRRKADGTWESQFSTMTFFVEEH
jgi:hypothetical protein